MIRTAFTAASGCLTEPSCRTEDGVREVRDAGARIKFISDGDVAGAIMAAREGTGPNPNTPQPLAALQAVFMNHVEFVIAYPGIPRIIFQELQHAQDTPLKARVRGLMQQYRKLIVDLLQQAQPRLAPGIDLQAASVIFIGSVQGLVMQSMVNGNVNSMAIQAPGVFAIYLRGLTSKDTP